MIRSIVSAAVCALGVGALGALGTTGAGCLSRPAVAETATTKTNFVDTVHQVAVDKIDILFAIDNSASMGDKQAYLAQAVPDLIARLVTPNCVDPVAQTIYGASDANGNCAQGQVEFPPVHDMHVGIVSTSLGERGGDQCPGVGEGTMAKTPTGNTVSYHWDDRGELLARAGDAETALADAGQQDFLNWFPTSNVANGGKAPSAGAPPLGDAGQLGSDFADLVTGVAVYGCGIESQLESWYRFLIQPDPYDQIVVQGDTAVWQGVDQTILQQRHDFLRPDSLVAIVVLTDENDSEIDVRSLGGQGWKFLSGAVTLPRGTSACATDPASAACQPCADLPDGGAADPSCQQGRYTAETDWGFNANLRHVHMKQKYGFDYAQFPIDRYVVGLTSPTVPDRTGEYPTNAVNYVGTQNCTNPLFAASLPDGTSTDPATLCNLPKGARSPKLVFYAHIGGVPHQLLQQDPTNPDSPQKDALLAADWQAILGADPLHYDYSGIDPHMVESYQPRPGIAAGPSSPNDQDPVHGREWITNQDPRESLPVDREYACTFPVAARDCTNPANLAAGCDCPGGMSPEDTPPVCDTTVQTNQVRAKAYPTIRELLLGKLMGDQGVISSLCPIHTTDNATGTDPLYGYRPAMAAIVGRLKTALSSTCVPQPLAPDPSGIVPCLALVTLPPASGGGCDATLNMTVPSSDVLGPFLSSQHEDWLQAGGSQGGAVDPSTLTVCQVGQLTGGALAGGTCAQSADKGWCYVTGAAAGTGCQQGVLFSPGTLPNGATVKLQCIEAAATAAQ